MVEITGLGWIILPLSLLLFISGTSALFWGFVATAPFFQTAVAVVPDVTIIRPAYVIGTLWILRTILDWLQGRPLRFPHRQLTFASCAFLLVAFLSLSMPLFLGPISVIPEGFSVGAVHGISFSDLSLSRSSLTQLGYPSFYICVLLLTTSHLYKHPQPSKVARVLALLAIPIVASGILYFIAGLTHSTDLIDPLYNFVYGSQAPRNSLYSGFAGTARMQTLAGEPGYTSMYLLMTLGITTGFSFTTSGSYRRRWYIASGMILLSLLLTQSTVAYIGLVLFSSLLLASIAQSPQRYTCGRNARRLQLWSLSLLLPPVIVLLIPSLREYLITEHWAKLTGGIGSGAVRLLVIEHNIQTFLESPLLGVGYGNDRSLAAVVFLLANVGIIGTAFFFYINLIVFHRCWRLLKQPIPDLHRTIALATVSAGGSIFILLQFGKSESALLFPYYWIFLGLGAAVYWRVPGPSFGTNIS